MKSIKGFKYANVKKYEENKPRDRVREVNRKKTVQEEPSVRSLLYDQLSSARSTEHR